MPIYEYQCDACGYRLEKLQKISDDPLKDCPQCAGASLRKLVSTVAFRLKGGGWYETDFKEEKTQKNLAKDDNKPKEPNGKTNGKPENKESKKDGKDSGAGSQSSSQENKPESRKSTSMAEKPSASSPPD